MCNRCKLGPNYINNSTVEYSQIELMLCNAGNGSAFIRARALEGDSFSTQEILNITYCPFCGEKIGNKQ